MNGRNRYAVWFWDHGRWDQRAGTERRTRAETAALAQRMNRLTDHTTRREVFEGHRFRVRSVGI